VTVLNQVIRCESMRAAFTLRVSVDSTYPIMSKNPGAPTSSSSGGKWWAIKTALLAVVVFCTLQWAWEQSRGTAVERLVVNQMTVSTAVALINLATPAVQSRGVDASIKAEGGGLNIRSGCEGTEVLFLLAAALAVTPGAARARWGGLVAGALVVFALNQLRVVVLFYSARHDPALFAQLHSLVAPLVMVAGTLLFYVVWVEGMRRRAGQRARLANTAVGSA
jgi:exosortase family protein XrtM